MKTRTVQPCGILSTSGLDYFLLSPTPVVRDSWQDDRTHRFVGVPMLDDPIVEDEVEIYPYARHIVSNAFAIEYVADMQPIQIEVLEDIDVTFTEQNSVSEDEIQEMLGDDE